MLKVLAIAAAVFAAAPAIAQVAFWENEWPITDFEQTSVDFIEIMSGGPPKDGIPALASVEFITVSENEIPLREPVIALEIAGQVPRAYPLRYLTWHEIVNDVVGEAGYRIVWRAGMASALDGRVIATSRDIGSIRVYDSAGNNVEHEVVFAFAFNAFAPNGAWMLP